MGAGLVRPLVARCGLAPLSLGLRLWERICSVSSRKEAKFPIRLRFGLEMGAQVEDQPQLLAAAGQPAGR